MNRNHQSQNTSHHTSHGRENIARKQMGKSMRTPTSFNPKELQRISYQRSAEQRFNSNQDFDDLNNNSFDEFSGNYYERSYQGWMSHTDEDMMNNRNYRSDGPGPVEIEARDKYTHKHLHNPSPDLHNKMFSYRGQAEMDDVNNEHLIQSFRGMGPKGYVKSDDRIEEEVCEILARDRHIDATSIYVGVEKGIVKLSGTVRTRQEKFVIEDAVENISGVNEVKNNIKVEKNYNAISYDF